MDEHLKQLFATDPMAAAARAVAQPDTGFRHIDACWKAARAVLPAPRAVRIAVAGNGTLTPSVTALRFQLLCRGIAAEVWEAPFDQWAIQLAASDSDLHRFAPSVLVLHLSSLGLTASATALDLGLVELARNTLCHVAAEGRMKVVLVLPEPLEEAVSPNAPEAAWHRRAMAMLFDGLPAGVAVVDPAVTLGALGATRFFASRYWYNGKLPFHPDALVHHGARLAAAIAPLVHRPVKLIACDLDNTLWGGILGEDGWAGVQVDPHGRGGPFARFQAWLKRQVDHGVMLAAVSKNNPADVAEAFERRSDMPLKPEDFVEFAVGWGLKSESIAAVARRLNIGLQNVCFLDDSAFERAEVRAALPEAIVPELPAEPEAVVPHLIASGLFDLPPDLSREDATRRDLVRTEAERWSAMQGAPAGDAGAFLDGLRLWLRPEAVAARNLDRVVELLHKTNQFNLTTHRHERAAVAAMAGDPAVYAYAFHAGDRFGEHGLTGVLIARPAKDGAYVIDSWLQSCRILGRTYELAAFDHLVAWLRGQGVAVLRAQYRPTAKNAPVVDLLPQLGFVHIGESDGSVDYLLTLADAHPRNRHVAEAPQPSQA